MSRKPLSTEVLEISVEFLASEMPGVESGEYLLIDCREPDEFDINRIPNARLFPLSGFPDIVKSVVDEGKPCFVYCHHGIRSQRAALMLRSMGLMEAWSVEGGIDMWSDKVDPSVIKY